MPPSEQLPVNVQISAVTAQAYRVGNPFAAFLRLALEPGEGGTLLPGLDGAGSPAVHEEQVIGLAVTLRRGSIRRLPFNRRPTPGCHCKAWWRPRSPPAC